MRCLDSEPRVARVGASAILSLLVALAGCRTHEPRELEVSKLADAFLERTPDGITSAASEPEDSNAVGEIDVDRAVDIALVFNDELRRLRAEAGVAEAIAENAGLWTDPEIGLEFTRILESIANPNELFGTIAFTIPISGRLDIEKERLGLALAAELASIEAAEWGVAHEVRRRWVLWSALAFEAESVAALLQQTGSLLEIVVAMESLGEIPRIESRLFRLAEVRTRARLVEIESRREQARHAVFAAIGLPPLSRWSLIPSAAPSPPEVRLDLAAGVSHPEVEVARIGREVAEKRLEEEIRRQWPDLVIGPGYGEQDGYRQFTLGLSLPIPIFNGNRQAIEAALAERDAADVAVAVEVERAMARIAASDAALRDAERRAEIVEGELLPLAELQYAEARELARLGEVNTLIILDSLVQRLEASLQSIAAQRDVAIATVGLAEALGPAAEADSAEGAGEANRTSEDPPVANTAPAIGVDS